jgi:CelD/BcsL family acetyltransferase involved in cellulose biosynthesis
LRTVCSLTDLISYSHTVLGHSGRIFPVGASRRPARHKGTEPVAFSPAMCADVHWCEEHHGYRGRAVISLLRSNHSKPAGVEHSLGSDVQELTHCGNIHVTVVSSLDEARAFGSEWAKFADESGGSNPFVHPDWMLPWAERFVHRNEQLYFLAARQDGRLVGVAPFYRRSWALGLAHSMQLWGTGRHSDLTEMPGLLVDQTQPRNVTRALIGALCAQSNSWDWAYVPLQDPLWFQPEWLPRGGTIIPLTGTVRASVVRSAAEPGPLPVKRNVRESLRRARNRLTRDFAGRWTVDRATSRADVLNAMTDLQALHAARSRMAGKETHPNVLRNDADASYLRAVVTAAADRGGVCVYRLLVDGQAIAALLVLRTPEVSYLLLSGMSQEAWDYSAVTLLQGCVMDDAEKLGHRHVNLSTGPNTAKMRWSEEILVHPEFVLVHDRPLSLARYSGYSLAAVGAAVQRERHRHKLLVANSPGE